MIGKNHFFRIAPPVDEDQRKCDDNSSLRFPLDGTTQLDCLSCAEELVRLNFLQINFRKRVLIQQITPALLSQILLRLYLLPLLGSLELVSAFGVVGDVERVVGGRRVRVLSALDDEGVGFAPDYVNLGNEETVDVPRNAPADVT